MEINCCFNDCRTIIKSVNDYRIHFRINHSFAALGKYECTFHGCQKKFMDSKSLLDHLSKLHKIAKSENSESVNNSKSPIQFDEICQSISSFESQSTVCMSQSSQNDNNTEIPESDEDENMFENIFLDFLMNLHAKSKLSKEVIKSIFDRMKVDVIDKICIIAGVDENIQLDINTAYKKLNTQYKFEKALKENDFLTSGKILM